MIIYLFQEKKLWRRSSITKFKVVKVHLFAGSKWVSIHENCAAQFRRTMAFIALYLNAPFEKAVLVEDLVKD